MGRYDESYYTLPEDFRIKTLEEMNALNYSQYEGMITYFTDDKEIPNPMRTVEDLSKVHEKAPIYYGRGGEKYGASAHLTKEARENNDIDEDAKAIVKETASDADSYGYSSLGGINASYLSSFLEDEDDEEEEIEEIEEETEVVLLDDDFDGAFSASTDNEPTASVSTAYDGKPEVAAGSTYDSKPDTEVTAINPRLAAIRSTSVDSSYMDNIHDEPFVANVNVSATKDKSDGLLSNLISVAIAFAIACGLAFVIIKFVAIPSILSGTSMCDTINDGDKILVEKLSYRFGKPERFDLVEFEGPDGTDYVKRIVGMPGEYVTANEGYIYINGQMLSDDIYGKELIDKSEYGRLENGVLLDENEYFVVGDNRNNSLDSRDDSVGNLFIGQFKGKVCFKLWPPEPIK